MSTENTEVTEPVEPETEGAKPDDEQLGEAGIAALKSEREARKAAEKERSELAARIKEFEDRDKSESQKQQEALEQAKRELAELTVAKTRAEVAAAKGVPAGLLSGSTQEELEASADALIAFKGEQPKPKLHLPSEGKQPTIRETVAPGVPRMAAAFEEEINQK